MFYTKEIIRMKSSDYRWVRKGVLRLYFSGQTKAEKMLSSTLVRNGEGFSAADSRMGSRIAKKFLTHSKLSRYEWARAVDLYCKYAGQLANYANSGTLSTGNRLFY